MPVVISMLRGVNVGGHNKIRMEALRTLYQSLGLLDARTFIQSGNVIFRTDERDHVLLTHNIESAIEREFGFRPRVIVRTASELRKVIARNPFAKRTAIDPGKLLAMFLASDPGPEARAKILAMNIEPEELRMDRRELYIYYPDGMARPKLSWPQIEKILKTPGTGRNWNTVTKLLDMAEKLEEGNSAAST